MPLGICTKEKRAMDPEASGEDFVTLLMRAGRVRSLESFVTKVAELETKGEPDWLVQLIAEARILRARSGE
jgi:hypothetical protein